ncbi:MAG: TIGR04283 family arsenosugar biosynthesis glycosyltransferase [Caulobacterales bacterium]|nr:TIGR04283 family arsenosugar biosynthesis glycosyltransferase [Caulobacterales bacterium]
MSAAPPPALRRRVSILIPTLNEAGRIGPLLRSLEPLGAGEILVIDAGSADGTADIARARPLVRVLTADRGRGLQLDAGAQAATGDILLFLHADTRLPPRAITAITAALADPSVAGGAFRLRFDARHPLLALFAAATRFDTAFTTFGDQAFFVRREAYAAAGGCPPWPLLEDVELRRRLKRVGRFVKLRACVTTSARRFQADGVLRRQLKNAWILALFALGVSPARLSAMYANGSGAPSKPGQSAGRLIGTD